MSRLSRDARLETREARSRLKARHEPYWRQIHSGLSIGYRKGPRGGAWLARHLVDGKYRKKGIGTADDRADANGLGVLDYAQAHRKVLAWADASALEGYGRDYTVAQAVGDYLASAAAHGKSHRKMRSVFDLYVLPKFGNRRVADLKSTELLRWQENLLTTPRRRRGMGLVVDSNDPEAMRRRKATANRVRTNFFAALNHAYHHGIVASADAWRRVKPFRCVETPRDRNLSEAECGRLLNACEPDFRQLVRAALLTGCRYGELIRLEACDYNPAAGAVTIRTSKGGRPRHVPLTDEGRAFFARAAAGKRRGELIFLRADGQPWRTAHQTRRMLAASEAARLDPPASFHDLRRTYGSLLAIRGVPLHVIAVALGHGDTRMTEKHYAHLQPSYVSETIRANLPSFGGVDNDVIPLRPR